METTSVSILEGKTAPTLDSRVFVFDRGKASDSLTIAHELIRGGFPEEALIVCEGYDEALASIPQFEDRIVAAIIDLPLAPNHLQAYRLMSNPPPGTDCETVINHLSAARQMREDYQNVHAPLYRRMHSQLLESNPNVKIFHVMPVSYDHLLELARFGVIRFNIDGIIPARYGGPVEENPICIKGKELQAKYFSSPQNNPTI